MIRGRLGLDEDWFAITNRPVFFEGMTKTRLNEFENAFGQAVRLGCKWEVMLACLVCYHTYNARQVVRPARYDADEELTHLPEKVWKPGKAARPPGSERRSNIVRNLKAAAGDIANYEDLLSALGRLTPPPVTTWVDPLSDSDMRDVRLTADDAVLYVQQLLTWCRRLVTDSLIGNFKTVESVGQLVPCVYVEVVASKATPGKRQRLPLEPVAGLLNSMSGRQHYRQGQLRVALNRFERDYARVHKNLSAKIESLHLTSSEPPDGWKQLFAVEDRRRRSR
jgi:hypothetical protein